MYWALGGWAIVVLGPLFYFTDRKLRAEAWYEQRPLVTLAGAILISYLLYFPVLVLFLWLVSQWLTS